jgi:hypothetical protein
MKPIFFSVSTETTFCLAQVWLSTHQIAHPNFLVLRVRVCFSPGAPLFLVPRGLCVSILSAPGWRICDLLRWDKVVIFSPYPALSLVVS